MAVIPEGYEQTPRLGIKRSDGKVSYVFTSLSDPFASLIVIDDEVLDWTTYLNSQLEVGLIKK